MSVPAVSAPPPSALAAAAAAGFPPLGWWVPAGEPVFDAAGIGAAVARLRSPLPVLWHPQRRGLGVVAGGRPLPAEAAAPPEALPLVGSLPAVYPEWLGDPAFQAAHGVRYGYVVGEMANGIATGRMVVAAAQAGLLGFFGAAGLLPARVEREIAAIAADLGPSGLPWGANLIHSPNEPAIEEAVVDLYLRRGVRRMSASAFMALRPSVVRYACAGLSRDGAGRIVRAHHVFAKISRPEVARQFMSPPPAAMLDALVSAGRLTPEEAALGARLPVAEDVTVEADSAGHTDNRPLTGLLPTVLSLRDALAAGQDHGCAVRVGAAGGLGTPQAVAAAFAMGAAYVLTGSVNQAATEAGQSEAGRRLLARAELTDVMMAPAADMFELGVRVQVLRRGTLFGPRASQLYDLFTAYPSLEALPLDARTRLERDVFHMPLDEVWAVTRSFFQGRDPSQLTRAAGDPKHRMALVFRWYLGNASRWAIGGEAGRQADYQIWCGPAMGAFNDWVAGSFLADPANRGVVQIALNLLEGAAHVTRAQQARAAGLPVPPAAFRFAPRPLS